jgi:glycosyltransferase involved in cell wall biosynthesis
MTPRRPHIVAVVLTYAPAVGGAHLLASILEHLSSQGYRATVITYDAASMPDLKGRGAGLSTSDVVNGVRIIRVSPAGGRVARLLYQLSKRGSLGGLVHRFTGIDLPYWGGRPSGVALARAVQRSGGDVLLSVGWFGRHVPLVHAIARAGGLSIVGLPLFHLTRPSAAWPRQRWLARSTKALVCLSEPEAAHARALGARNVHIIPPGLPSDWGARADGQGWRAARGIAPDRPLVLFVGRQVRHKGAPLVIAAMHHVWQQQPDALLVLAGRARNRDRATADALANLSATQQQHVMLVDDFADDDAPSMMQACSVLALPSEEESFGLVYLQAWLAGRPVVGADIPSTRWLIQDGENGLLVPPNDPGAMASALLRCLQDPVYAVQFGMAGQRRASSVFSRESQDAGWCQLLDALCKERR